MGGQAVRWAVFDRRGLVGDRWFAVEDSEGRFASGKNTRRFRRRDAVFDYVARTTSDGQVWVARKDNDWRAGDPRLDLDLSERMGSPVRVMPEREVPHQDMGAVSLVGTATLDWCSQAWGDGGDPRRLRVNLLIETSEPFIEETWVGRQCRIGTTTLEVVERTPRCRMVDIAQDGVLPRTQWLKSITRDRDMFLAVYADVRSPGECSVGDKVDVG